MSIPANWTVARFDEVAEVVTGSTPSTKCPEYYGGDIPFIAPADLDQQMPIAQSKSTLTELGADQARRLPAGAILVCCIGATIGKVGVTSREATTNQQINALIPNAESLDSKYGYYFCKSISQRFGQLGTSTTLRILNKGRFSKIELPLPPLSEQKRIAEILDRAEALRAKRRAALALLDELTQSIFLDMFGDRDWPRMTVAELCREKEDCVGEPFGSDLTQMDYVEAPGVPVIRGQNLATEGPFMCEEGFVYVSETKASKLARNSACRGDVIVSQRGARLAGQVAMIPDDSAFASHVVSQSQMRVRPDTSRVDPLFLTFYFRSRSAVRRMEKLTISTGVPHINLGILRDFEIDVPDLKVQQEFVRRAGRVMELKDTVHLSAAVFDSAFASLQQRAFRGEL